VCREKTDKNKIQELEEEEEEEKLNIL